MHPHVFMSPQKEPHCFNSDSRNRRVRELNRYESLYNSAPAGARAIGEASILYLHSKIAAANILNYRLEAFHRDGAQSNRDGHIQ